MKDFFKLKVFTTGFILGLILLSYIIYHIIQIGFEPLFLGIYLSMFILILMTVNEDESNTYNFLIGINIPFTLFIILIIYISDLIRKKDG